MLGLATLALALGAHQVAAHGGVLYYSIGGQWYNGWAPYNSPTGQTSIQRPWATYDPIQSVSASTLACNDDGSSSGSQLSATVAAGSKVVAYWNNPWPHPYGPQLTYLAQCPGSTCTGVNANSLKWFKIDHAGLLSGSIASGQWAAGLMIANNNTWTSTIPASVPSGAYLIRFETIALHSLPAQMYPECAQLIITGGGSLAPTSSELVSFPGAYGANDPGLTVDLYSNTAASTYTYTIPGPPLYAGAKATVPSAGGGSGGGSGTTTTPNGGGGTTTKPTTTSKSTTAPATTTTASTGTVPQYGQCGGQGWTGGTVCISPYKCTVSNAYYSQCL